MKNRKRLVWIIALVVLLLLLAAGGVEAYRILYRPQYLFKGSATPAVNPSAQPDGTGATAAPDAAQTRAPDITAGRDILNVLLIGVDRSQTEGKLSGEDPHADVMMVVAIHFNEKKVDLISLPRDTFIHAPDIMHGVYKLNASFNVGGGFDSPGGGGFLKVCEAAEYMLGGIPVDYYYAVDFTSLVKVVDTIGGVDYEVENRAYSLQNKKGMQHMDGQDVLFYMRSRKVGPEQGDPNRVNRQKKMLTAIFNELKQKGRLSMLPDLVGAANSGVYTNAALDQTLALANFAKNVNADNIGMYSMTGHYYDKGNWRYCFTMQKERLEIIKQVYGIDVPEQTRCTPQYADWLYDYGFGAIRYLKTADQLLAYTDLRKAELTAGQQEMVSGLSQAYSEAQASYNQAAVSMKGADNRAMVNDKKALRTCAEQLAKSLGYGEELVWTYNNRFWLDPAINEVEVDFR